MQKPFVTTVVGSMPKPSCLMEQIPLNEEGKQVHGSGADKYDNIRIGLNSRLDTMQAAVLLRKLEIFDKELVLSSLKNVVNDFNHLNI